MLPSYLSSSFLDLSLMIKDRLLPILHAQSNDVTIHGWLQVNQDTDLSDWEKPRLHSITLEGKRTTGISLEANERVFGISISGDPGSTGSLGVYLKSGGRQQTILDLAFELAPCLWGFHSQEIVSQGILKEVC